MEIDIRWGMESTIRWNGPGWYAGRTFPSAKGEGEVWEAEMVASDSATLDEAGIAARMNGYGTPFYLADRSAASKEENAVPCLTT